MPSHLTVATAIAPAILILPACFGDSSNTSPPPPNLDASVEASLDASLPTTEAGPSHDAGMPSGDAPADTAQAGEGSTTTTTVGVVLTIAAGQFQPFVSGDGRYVAFSSDNAMLVAGDTNAATDTFVWDTCVGATAPAGCAPSTTRVSVANDGSQLSQGVYGDGAAISADGRFVVFDSPNTGTQIYVRDTCAGQSGGVHALDGAGLG